MTNQPTDLVPHIGYKEARDLYRNSDAWRRFAAKAQRHPFMRTMLERRDFAHGCAWCKLAFSRPEVSQVHHTDYNNFCSFAGSVEIPAPTPKRPKRIFKGPDCEGCFYDNRDGFEECASRLVLVHNLCNRKISRPNAKAKPISGDR